MVHNEMFTESQFVTSSFALIDRANTDTDELFVLMPPEQYANIVSAASKCISRCFSLS